MGGPPPAARVPTLGSVDPHDAEGGPTPCRTVSLNEAEPATSVAPRQIHVAHDDAGPTFRQALAAPGAETSPVSMSARLAAAKPVTWRGKGDLAQYSWTGNPLKGSWLVIDLWAGYSGLVLAMLCLGVHCYALAAECNPTARACAAQVMPQIVHVDAVEKIQVRDLREFLRRRKVRGILVGGGSPCQANSSLNAGRRGLGDLRSLQPQLLARLVEDLSNEPLCQGLEIVAFLENVHSMPPPVLMQYCKWMKSNPISVNAASCSWTQRLRLFWLCSRRRGLEANLSPPAPWQWAPTNTTHGLPELVYAGAKPIPARLQCEDNFAPMLDPAQVMKNGGKGAMHTFTREFYHPGDRIKQVSPAAAARFEADNRRFPPGAYEEHSLLWHEARWRQPSPAERAQMLGIPPAAVDAVEGTPDEKRKCRNSLLGNGFHLPSLLAILCLLPALLEAKMVPPPTPPDMELHSRVMGTIWEPGRLQSFPDILDGAAVVTQMRSMFLPVNLSDDVWSMTCRRLDACQLHQLQAFASWRRLRGDEWCQLGPIPVYGRARSRIFAGLSGQRYAPDTSKGLDHLLPPGLGPEAHMAAAQTLPSPFAPHPWPEPDVEFVIDTIWIWREFLPALAQRQRDILRSVHRALQPLDQALRPHRCLAAAKVAAQKNPAFVACLTALLRWPDIQQPLHLLQGYPIVGPVHPCGVFREIHQTDKATPDSWLGDSAQAALEKLLRSRPPSFARDILDVTETEMQKGFCGPLRSKLEMDREFGPGGWRFLERFLVVQPDGKKRVIDNGRKSGHNTHTQMYETISTVTVDFVATVARMLFDHMAAPVEGLDDQYPWCAMRLGTDDLPDAYRGLPVCDSHLCYSNIAIFVPQVGWRFTTLYGLAYGLEAAVVAFNRFPQLGVAIARRCLLSCCAAYFDDELSVEFIRDACVSQRGLKMTFTFMGAPPQPAKCFVPTFNRHYLGTSVHVGDALTLGVVRFQPKTSTQWKVLARLQHAVETQSLDRDTAGKLRGDLNWMWSMCAGYVGRIAGPVFTDKQNSESPNLDGMQLYTLQLLIDIVKYAPPRDIVVAGPLRPVVHVYSDASFEHGILRLGWIIFHPVHHPVGGTCVVPQTILDFWQARQQQIYPGEALAALVIPRIHPTLFFETDVLWFIDNEAAVASLIRASSRQPDVHLICLLSHAWIFKQGTRIWYEWIDSASNPSDGLSRDGLNDFWTLQQGWDINEYPFPCDLLPDTFFSSLLDSLF